MEGAGSISMGDVMVVLFCEMLPQLVEGNIPFHKENEWACNNNSGKAFHKQLYQSSCACLHSFTIDYRLYLSKLIQIVVAMAVATWKYVHHWVLKFHAHLGDHLEADSARSF